MKALSQEYLIGITLIKMKRYKSACIEKLQETLNFFLMYTFSEKCKNIIVFQNIVSPILFASSKDVSVFFLFLL